MALQVGIVGLPGAGKTTLFNALTKAGVGLAEFGKEHVGMAPIDDERLESVAGVVGARKVTPAAIRVVDVPGTGAAQLGNLRQVDAILAVVDGFSSGADPSARPREPRARAARRRPRPRRAAARACCEAGQVGRSAASRRGGRARGAARAPRRRRLAPRPRRSAAVGARAADDQAAAHRRERPERHRPEARGRAGRAPRRGGGGVPRGRVGAEGDRAASVRVARPDLVHHRRRQPRPAPGRCAAARPRSRPPRPCTATSHVASSVRR